MEEQVNFLPLLLVLFLAFAVPLLVGRVRMLPVVVGEIIAGMIIGRSGLDLVGHGPVLEILSDMGLAFLMFLAGMEINLNHIIPARGREQSDEDRRLLGLTLLVYFLTLGIAVPGGFALNALGFEGSPWLIAFALSATSLGVVLPILKRDGLIQSMTGRAIFYSSLLADFFTILLLTFFLITLERGLNLEVLSVSLLFLAFVLVYQLGVRVFRVPVVQRLFEELSHVTVQIKVRGAITLLMAFVVLAGLLGVELILGAFLAGIAVTLLRYTNDSAITEKLEAFGYGFFIPVFFIMVGANLNLRALADSPGSLFLLPLLVIIALLVKTVPMLLFRRLLPWRDTLAAAALVNTHLSIEVAIAVIGVRLGLLSEAANITIVLFATLTVLLMPVLFNLLMPKKPPQAEPYTLIYGLEDLGFQVGQVLLRHGEKVRFMDPDPTAGRAAMKMGFEVVCGQSVPGCLEEAIKLGPVKSLLVLSSQDTRNLLVCYAARQLGIEHIVALINDPSKLSGYRSLGVNTFNPTMYQANTLAMIARNQDIYTLLTSNPEQQDVREVYLRNPLYIGSAVKNMNLTGNLTIVAIARNGEYIVPHGYTRLETGDRLTLFGSTPDILRAADLLERHTNGRSNNGRGNNGPLE